MKKVVSAILALCIIFSFTSCNSSTDVNSGNSENEIQETLDNNMQYSKEMLQMLEKAVETTQPGTVGTSLKAIYAVKDILWWLGENKPDVTIVSRTVKQFFETFEYKDEAALAFQSIRNAFDTITESDAAQHLLDAVEIKLEELELSDEVVGYAQQLFEEIEKYSDNNK